MKFALRRLQKAFRHQACSTQAPRRVLDLGKLHDDKRCTYVRACRSSATTTKLDNLVMKYSKTANFKIAMFGRSEWSQVSVNEFSGFGSYGMNDQPLPVTSVPLDREFSIQSFPRYGKVGLRLFREWFGAKLNWNRSDFVAPIIFLCCHKPLGL